jgi:hypothetical protein
MTLHQRIFIIQNRRRSVVCFSTRQSVGNCDGMHRPDRKLTRVLARVSGMQYRNQAQRKFEISTTHMLVSFVRSPRDSGSEPVRLASFKDLHYLRKRKLVFRDARHIGRFVSCR